MGLDTTIVFALAGAHFLKYLAALIISLVLPLANVYLGVLAIKEAGKYQRLLGNNDLIPATEGQTTHGSDVASGLTIAGSVTISVIAMLYINHKANNAKPTFLAQRRIERCVRVWPISMAQYAFPCFN